jgi:hypothetical protein
MARRRRPYVKGKLLRGEEMQGLERGKTGGEGGGETGRGRGD